MRQRLRINLNIGAGCFVRCIGCYNHFGKSFVDKNVILTFLRYMREHGSDHVTIGGGDPLTYPDILSLLESIKELGFRINLDTVGTPLLSDAESIFFKRVSVQKIDAGTLARLVDLLGIPLDGPSSEVIATFRANRAHIYEEQIAILKLLDSLHATVCINTVVHQGNIQYLQSLPELIKSFSSVVKWQLFQFMPIGPLAFKNKEKYLIEDRDFSLFKERLLHSIEDLAFREKLEFKSRADRKGNYLFIDSDGVAWVPNVSYSLKWESETDNTNQKTIIGRISEMDDFPKIKSVILEPQNYLDTNKTR
ncbi:MAG: radical SAM protein [Verrucomicrobia bacterium]|nr:radical SAM protein [Verrucomicrobiota bacterium]